MKMSLRFPQRRSKNSSRKMAAQIARQMAAVLPGMVAQMQQQNVPTPAPTAEETANSRCNYKYFNSCGPPSFDGSEGATGLLQWFEGIEGAFLNSDCPENLQVRYGTSVLKKRALTWWNGEKHTRGAKEAYALTWDTVKELMTKEFCPRNEVKKLEAEFWELQQDSGENMVYNNRFHELSLLVPHMVKPLSRKIEKYIEGLPMQIQDAVFGSNPTTLDAAIRLAATLTDNHVRAGTLTKKGAKEVTDKVSTEPKTETSTEFKTEPSFNNKRKFNNNNFAITTPPISAIPLNQVAPITQFNKKPYTGILPLCNTCLFHHPASVPCRQCTNCGRFGHLNTTCRFLAQPNQPIGRGCYQCGDPNHFRSTCPQLVNTNNVLALRGNQEAHG